jgi:hypothetical protein
VFAKNYFFQTDLFYKKSHNESFDNKSWKTLSTKFDN